jgi:23S rRNA pseudouridine955/2504/2580 synthase
MAYDKTVPGPEESGAPRSSGVQYVEAGEGDVGQRLDNFLTRTLKGVPRTHVYRLLRKGEVRVNSRRAKPDLRLAAGDRIRLPPMRRPDPAQAATRPPSPSLQNGAQQAGGGRRAWGQRHDTRRDRGIAGGTARDR